MPRVHQGKSLPEYTQRWPKACQPCVFGGGDAPRELRRGAGVPQTPGVLSPSAHPSRESRNGHFSWHPRRPPERPQGAQIRDFGGEEATGGLPVRL